MNKLFLKSFMSFNTFLIRISKGKIGGQLGHQKILVMNTIGRLTGKKYATPIAYFPINNGYYVIASNWGQDKNASWYYNLKHQPDITIEVNGHTIPVHAREVVDQEYADLCANAVNHHPDYLHYKEMTSRHIPIIIFEVN
jgi:deazaflavin-dependent oxidoreductase (nitroreductase family)